MKKLKLDDLKVKSFVTSLDEKNVNTIKGGGHGDSHGVGCSNENECNSIGEFGCDSAIDACPTINGPACLSLAGTCAAETQNNLCL